jgi:hypothetical protein
MTFRRSPRSTRRADEPGRLFDSARDDLSHSGSVDAARKADNPGTTMRGRYVTLAALASAAGVSAYWLYSSSRAAVEHAPYDERLRDGAFELRDYPALVVARAVLDGRDRTFERLVRFLARGNDRNEKIAMTAPVLIERHQGEGSMAFVMPRQVSVDLVPQPTDTGVALETRPPARMAVYRFSGLSTPEKEAHATTALESWMRKQGFEPAGAPIVAYYDAPMIPGYLRRNEVLIPVRDEHTAGV